eukprot:719974-Rhodomonas_salina.1
MPPSASNTAWLAVSMRDMLGVVVLAARGARHAAESFGPWQKAVCLRPVSAGVEGAKAAAPAAQASTRRAAEEVR